MDWACVPADKHLAGLVILSAWGRSRFGVPRVGMLSLEEVREIFI